MHKKIILSIFLVLILSSCGKKNEKYIEDFKDRFYITQNKSFGLSLTTRQHRLYNIDEKGKKHFILKENRKDFPEISFSYYDKNWHAYYYDKMNTIIYRRTNSSKFNVIKKISVDNKDQFPFVPELYKNAVELKKAVEFYYPADFLTKLGDEQTINLIKNYAEGNFTESQKNTHNPKYLDKIQKYSIKILKNNNIF